MLLPRSLHFYIPRGGLARRFFCLNSTPIPLRFTTGVLRTNVRFSSTISQQAPKAKTRYPARLLVHHAGTGRTVFIGCLKVTTIFVFTFFALVAFPAQLRNENQPVWVAPAVAVLLCGTLPLLIVARTTSPFVAYVHLLLPPYARQSHELLTRYARNLPRDAEVDITTISFIGRPRVSRVKVASLQPAREGERWLSVENFVRDTTGLSEGRKWWMGRPVRRFAIRGGLAQCKESWVWDLLVTNIENKQARGRVA